MAGKESKWVFLVCGFMILIECAHETADQTDYRSVPLIVLSFKYVSWALTVFRHHIMLM